MSRSRNRWLTQEAFIKRGYDVRYHSRYTNSKYWKDFRSKYLEAFPMRCYVCEKEEGCHLHHVDYSRYGKEEFSDVIWLCPFHHLVIHSWVRAPTKTNWRMLNHMKDQQNKTTSDTNAYVEVSLASAINELTGFGEQGSPEDNQHKSSRFIKVELTTTPKMNKTGNRFFGRVRKVQEQIVGINWSYARRVASQQFKEGKIDKKSDSPFSPVRTWGVPVSRVRDGVANLLYVSIGINDQENHPNFYLALFPVGENPVLSCHYEYTTGPEKGRRLTKEEVEELKRFMKSDEQKARDRETSKRNQGTDTPVNIIKTHVQSVTALTFGGNHYDIIDDTPPAVSDDVMKLAMEDVESRRADRDKKKAVKKDIETAVNLAKGVLVVEKKDMAEIVKEVLKIIEGRKVELKTDDSDRLVTEQVDVQLDRLRQIRATEAAK